MNKIFIMVFAFMFAYFELNSRMVDIDNIVKAKNKNGNTSYQKNMEEDLNFKEFLKNYSTKCVLRSFGNGLIGYSVNKSIFIFNTVSNKRISITLSELRRTDKIQCFSFDGKYFYVKVKGYIFIFDINGNELGSYKLANISEKIGGKLDLYARDIFIDNKIFYLVSHDKYLLGFNFDSRSMCPIENRITYLFCSNDLCSLNSINFKFLISNNIYVLLDKRLAIIHKKSGQTLKNIYFKNLYNDMCFLNSELFLYSKNNFAFVDLNDEYFSINHSNEFNISGNPLIIKSDHINFKGDNYYANYIYTFFFNNVFFRYSHNLYDSSCFLINKAKCIQFVLNSFAISHVFFFDEICLLVLVDAKNKKFVSIKTD